MSELTVKLIILLLPGAIATLIFGKLILHKQWDSFKFVLYSILFGAFSFIILQLFLNILNIFSDSFIEELSIWNQLTDSQKIPYNEIGFSSVVAVILAFLISRIENKKIISKIAKKLGISNKYGDENLFSRFLNSSNTDYVYVRDIKNNLTYHGWVKSFSESETFSEIRLAEVVVYTYINCEEIYSIPEVYLSFNKHDIIIEKANF
ncbi:hypothetical protein CLU81_4146 [Flavobacterium sp. 9]|uniref:hypothetical protein n=1 Tax=Flavobacterium sp. 9 TaxID=2035198 RepID=UPI000C190AB2|nr:hypothetical protein [Flavobacterium sp. 9]PIF33530.1 hypothetical protein CLU81_4146 [Flavobacterium sp. 9]